MKQLIARVIKMRNPDFVFDPALTGAMLRNLLWDKSRALFRGLFFRVSFIGSGLMLGRGVRLVNKKNIKFGKWVKIDDYTTLNALGKDALSIGNNSSIGAFSRVIISTSFNHIGEHIRIGDNVGIGEYAYLGGGGGLEIGDNCIIGQYLSCHPENHNFEDLDLDIRHQGVTRSGITIGQNCWIGSKVTITDGVGIGPNCVLAAGAVITKSMPANSVVGGVPARVLKTR
jgi:acetyltransferase-like isoleucine patch superfamily enzyme